MTAPATYLALQRLARPLRVGAVLGWMAVALGAAALLLGAAAWMVGLGWMEAPWWVLVAWAAVGAVGAGAVWLVWNARTRLSVGGVAGGLEELGAWRRGALTALLDRSAAGTSPALLELADRVQADEVVRRGVAAAEPLARPVRALGLAGLGALALGLAAFGSAGPVHGPAAALWHPRRAWEATIAPVRIRAARGVVDRGDSTALELEAFGRRHATLWLRSPGEGWRPSGVALDSTGHARVTTGALQSDLFARLTSGSRTSDTVLIHVRLPVFLGTLSVTAHYPAYLGLEAEPVPTGGDTLLLPAGTRLDTQGEATAPLARAAWTAGERRAVLSVSGGRFTGSFVPQASGEYHLALATAGGAPLTADTVRLPIRLVADSAPQVDVPVPGADTLAPISLLLPLVVDARDDHGITSVTVESRRVSRLGLVDSMRRDTVTVPPGTSDRAILTHTLDLTRRGLLPGDTLRYSAVATDNTPQRQSGRSREYVLRLPTMSEVRAAQRQASDAVGSRLDSLSAASKQLERQTDDLASERPRPAEGQGEKSGESLSFEEAKKAESVARSQQELMRQAEALKQSLESLQKSAEAAGLGDTAWQRELSEIRDQLERALSPELRDRLQELQQALKDLDAERTKEALERLAEAQRETREALERSRELFKRAALEGDLANLSKESKALAQEQREWNEHVGTADSSRSARAERELAARTDSLAAALDKLGQAVGDSARQERLDAAGDQAQQAGQQMKQAATASQQGQRGKAKQKGEQAEQALDPLGDQLQQEREGMQQEWRQEVVAAIDQALAETSRLAERQLAVQEQLRSGGDAGSRMRAEQGAIEEGVQRLLEQVRKAAGKNALVPPEIGAALGGAQRLMQRTREAIANATPNAREGADQAGGAVDALNAAAYQLIRARGDVQGAGSGSGLAEALERMAQLAKQQGGLGQQGAGLLPMAGSGAIREQLRQLGAQQRALAEELQKLKGSGNMPGAGEMSEEAKDLAKRLEGGRLDRQVVERQERLFRRMLDAGRTLQGREEDERKERQSTVATDDSIRLPPALRAKLLSDDDRLRVPSWEELQQLSPEERRLVVDYFRRLSEPGGR
ncbi:MAG TPA: hypothetical protein VFN40_02285 [Gemmatimonadales bacterium]|nr:hypothetical protein [Gemmatimonadales bacterium]